MFIIIIECKFSAVVVWLGKKMPTNFKYTDTVSETTTTTTKTYGPDSNFENFQFQNIEYK